MFYPLVYYHSRERICVLCCAHVWLWGAALLYITFTGDLVYFQFTEREFPHRACSACRVLKGAARSLSGPEDGSWSINKLKQRRESSVERREPPSGRFISLKEKSPSSQLTCPCLRNCSGVAVKGGPPRARRRRSRSCGRRRRCWPRSRSFWSRRSVPNCWRPRKTAPKTNEVLCSWRPRS